MNFKQIIKEENKKIKLEIINEEIVNEKLKNFFGKILKKTNISTPKTNKEAILLGKKTTEFLIKELNKFSFGKKIIANLKSEAEALKPKIIADLKVQESMSVANKIKATIGTAGSIGAVYSWIIVLGSIGVPTLGIFIMAGIVSALLGSELIKNIILSQED